MDVMVWVVTFALIVLLVYSISKDPPSSGCLSDDAARARDAKLRRGTVATTPALHSEAEPDVGVPQAGQIAAERAAVPASAVATADMLRNPRTGETAAIPTNYRFAKKWIKEAMVEEGLLDRVYANSDLDGGAREKVRTALKQFRTLAKYQA